MRPLHTSSGDSLADSVHVADSGAYLPDPKRRKLPAMLSEEEKERRMRLVDEATRFVEESAAHWLPFLCILILHLLLHSYYIVHTALPRLARLAYTFLSGT